MYPIVAENRLIGAWQRGYGKDTIWSVCVRTEYREEKPNMYAHTYDNQVCIMYYYWCTYILTRHFPLLLHDFSDMKRWKKQSSYSIIAMLCAI